MPTVWAVTNPGDKCATLDLGMAPNAVYVITVHPLGAYAPTVPAFIDFYSFEPSANTSRMPEWTCLSAPTVVVVSAFATRAIVQIFALWVGAPPFFVIMYAFLHFGSHIEFKLCSDCGLIMRCE